MELAAALATRRSVRRFAPRPLDRSLIEDLVAAATRAPSAHNAQPWCFVVVDAQREALVEALTESLCADLVAEGMAGKEAERIAASKSGRFRNAPSAVLVCLDVERIKKGPRPAAERLLAAQSVAAAVQNLLLAAHDRGLGACWYCAPAFCPEAVRSALELPPGLEPQGLVVVGHPDEAPAAPPRRPLDEVILWR